MKRALLIAKQAWAILLILGITFQGYCLYRLHEVNVERERLVAEINKSFQQINKTNEKIRKNIEIINKILAERDK